MPISECSLEHNISMNEKSKVEEIIFLNKQRSLYFLLKKFVIVSKIKVQLQFSSSPLYFYRIKYDTNLTGKKYSEQEINGANLQLNSWEYRSGEILLTNDSKMEWHTVYDVAD